MKTASRSPDYVNRASLDARLRNPGTVSPAAAQLCPCIGYEDAAEAFPALAWHDCRQDYRESNLGSQYEISGCKPGETREKAASDRIA